MCIRDSDRDTGELRGGVLVPDAHHDRPPFRGGLVEGVQQHAVVLQHFYDRQQGLRIAELRLAQKRRDTEAVGTSAFGLAQAFYDLSLIHI